MSSSATIDFSEIDDLVETHLGKTFPAAQIEIRQWGRISFSRAYGVLDPDASELLTNTETRFDLASVSKLFTTAAFLSLVDQGLVSLDQPLATVLPRFSGAKKIAPYPDPLRAGGWIEIAPAGSGEVDAAHVTFRNVLAHNSGLPAWLPLFHHSSRAKMFDAIFETPFAYPTGTRSVYSDIGLILLGAAIETLTKEPLQDVIRTRVTAPLALASISFDPLSDRGLPANVAPTEFYADRGLRMRGHVHDENAFALGGCAGHAGLFGTAHDVAGLGQCLLEGGAPILSPGIVAEMTRLQAEDSTIRRGLGVALWSPDPEASLNPLPYDAFGHTGFTGTCLAIVPSQGVVICCLTNRVYYGRQNAAAIGNFRVALHRLVSRRILQLG